jgi:hypothetical protein
MNVFRVWRGEGMIIQNIKRNRSESLHTFLCLRKYQSDLRALYPGIQDISTCHQQDTKISVRTRVNNVRD